MKKNKRLVKSSLGKKKGIISTVITILFLLTFVLGLIPIFPFGTYEQVGDVTDQKFTPLVTIPIYPLILIYNALDNRRVEFFSNYSLLAIALSAIILMGYYYFISRLIIYFYVKIRGSHNGK